MRRTIGLATALGGLHGRRLVPRSEAADALIDPRTGRTSSSVRDRFTLAASASGAAASRDDRGTLPYISPEQTGQMNRSIDARDLYSLGVVLYELLTGRCRSRPRTRWSGCTATSPGSRARPATACRCPLGGHRQQAAGEAPRRRYQTAAAAAGSALPREWKASTGSRRSRSASATFRAVPDPAEAVRPRRRVRGARRRVRARRLGNAGARPGVGVLPASASRRWFTSFTHARERRGAATSPGQVRSVPARHPVLHDHPGVPELALDILAEGELGIARWRQRLAQALGANGQLVVDRGPQARADRRAAAAGARARRPSRRPASAVRLPVRGVFARPSTRSRSSSTTCSGPTPRACADRQLLTDGDTRHLLIIGAYRDNEVGSGHPLLRRARGAIRARDGRVLDDRARGVASSATSPRSSATPFTPTRTGCCRAVRGAGPASTRPGATRSSSSSS